MIHAMKGWKNVFLNTLTMRSIDSGANQESRSGGVVYGVAIVSAIMSAYDVRDACREKL